MISVIMPTYNSANKLGRSLPVLMQGVIEGLIKELIVVDGGSSDPTLKIAEEAGAVIVSSVPGRGLQLRKGAEKAKGKWLLFLHDDTELQSSWYQEVLEFCRQPSNQSRAACFRFALNDKGLVPRLLEQIVALRCILFGLPYGDQGLLISKTFYQQLGGYRALPLMEDVEFMGRVKRGQLHYFRTKAVTDAVRYQREGYVRRSLKNLTCLSAYFMGVAPEKILKLYEK